MVDYSLTNCRLPNRRQIPALTVSLTHSPFHKSNSKHKKGPPSSNQIHTRLPFPIDRRITTLDYPVMSSTKCTNNTLAVRAGSCRRDSHLAAEGAEILMVLNPLIVRSHSRLASLSHYGHVIVIRQLACGYSRWNISKCSNLMG